MRLSMKKKVALLVLLGLTVVYCVLIAINTNAYYRAAEESAAELRKENIFADFTRPFLLTPTGQTFLKVGLCLWTLWVIVLIVNALKALGS
jgi:hypothetical protein